MVKSTEALHQRQLAPPRWCASCQYHPQPKRVSAESRRRFGDGRDAVAADRAHCKDRGLAVARDPGAFSQNLRILERIDEFDRLEAAQTAANFESADRNTLRECFEY